jgi:hypothetical protein
MTCDIVCERAKNKKKTWEKNSGMCIGVDNCGLVVVLLFERMSKVKCDANMTSKL